jgi:predicted nucleotidyltransferase
LVTECVESALVELYAEMGGPASGAALAAVGSLARQELGPRSDIDLVLLHDGKSSAKIKTLAHDLWYPLWDARIRVDHAVRTPAECAEIAGRELSAGVGWRAGVATLGNGCLSCWPHSMSASLPSETLPICWSQTSRRRAEASAMCRCCGRLRRAG